MTHKVQDQEAVVPAYDLGHYLRPLQRQRKWLVAAVVVGLLLGLAYSVISKPTYSAAARVSVGAPVTTAQAVTANGSRTPNATVNMDTEAQNVKSTPVAAIAQKTLKTSTSTGALLGRISVTVPPNTTILRIACAARSAHVAQMCANAFANAYLTDRESSETAQINQQLASLRTQIAAQTTKLDADITAGTNATKHTPAKTEAFEHAADVQVTINGLDSQLSTLQGELPANAGNLQSQAGLGIASKTKRGIPPITGLVIGLLVGVGGAYGRERFNRKVRHRDDLVRAGIDLIAEITPPKGGAKAKRRDGALRTRFDQRVASVIAGSFDADGGVVYVAAVSPGQEDAEVAGHLATTLASVGHHVEIVRPRSVQDVGDYRSAPQPTSHTTTTALETGGSMLGWPGGADDAAEAGELVVASPTKGLLSPVETPANSVPMDIRMQLELARRRSQFVIIDGDPAVSDAQAYVLAGLSDASLLVVDPEATTRADLAEVLDQLSVTGSQLLGAVIWRPSGATRRTGNGSRTAGPTTHESRSLPHRPIDAAH